MKSLNRLEFIIGAILVLIFIIWAYDTCATTSNKYQPQEPSQQETVQQDEENEEESSSDNNTNSNANTTNTNPPAQQPVQAPPVQTAAFPTVYVKIDKLKMRDKPFLSGSQVLTELSLNTELYYLNNNTDYTDKITLEGVTYNEPWLEVQTKDGQSRGWVYGGGIRVYKLSN